ncbi:MAG: hypothetical protein M1511_12615 [Deltaproteobacteria bacterium]|nr:hypothetical protein [Deltaproteobacteria bacterium]
MDIKPIQIDIADNRAFTQLAFFVDAPGFLDEIVKIRAKYKINPQFDLSKSSEDELQLIRNTEFERDISEVRRKYNFPEMFDSVVRDAVLYNRITKFKTAYAKTFVYPVNSVHNNHVDFHQDEYMAIIVTPQSTEKDIKEAFADCRSDLFLSQTWKSPVYQAIDTDTVSNIKRDRDWYWRYKNGEHQHEIAVADNKGASYYTKVKMAMKYAGNLSEAQRMNNERYLNYVQDYTETVRKAIKRYKANLHRHLPTQ